MLSFSKSQEVVPFEEICVVFGDKLILLFFYEIEGVQNRRNDSLFCFGSSSQTGVAFSLQGRMQGLVIGEELFGLPAKERFSCYGDNSAFLS